MKAVHRYPRNDIDFVIFMMNAILVYPETDIFSILKIQAFSMILDKPARRFV